MKAQSIRKTLWLTSALLGVALLGGAAWYFTQVRPASASPAEDAWVKKSYDAYLQDQRTAKPRVLWPVSLDDLTSHITRPDLMSKESRIGVWAYVGPVPPSPREETKPTTVADQPKGLAAIGAPSMILLQPPPAVSMVKWIFPGSKKGGFFVTGEFIRESNTAKGRFKLTGIERPDAEIARFRLIYDIYDDETKDPVSKGAVAEFTLIKPDYTKTTFDVKPPPVAADPTGKPLPGAAGTSLPPSVAAGTPPPLADVRIDVKSSGDNSREVEFDDNAYRYFFYSNPDSLAADVKTEEIKEGIRISGISTGSVATQFGIQPGDIIKSINGTPIRNRAQALEVVKALPKDIARVTVVVQRNARDLVYNVDPRDPAVRKAAGTVRYGGGK